jgi:hypothetical protein
MAQIATNDPNYFLDPFSKGEFNDISQDASGFGSLPAAEQNQTYFVYSDGISSAEPEFIGQTLYNVKYLIDENGNVYKPNSDQTALFNLKNNFSRQNMIVETQTATQVLSNLLGEQQITDIGSLQPLIFSENGTSKNDYESTMSFAIANSAFVSGSNLNDIVFVSPTTDMTNAGMTKEAFEDEEFFYKGATQTFSGESFSFFPTITQGNNQLQFDTSSGVYTFDLQGGATSTADYGSDVSFNFQLWTQNASQATTIQGGIFPAKVLLIIKIEHSTDGGTIWNTLPLTNNSRFPGFFQNGNFVPGPSFGDVSGNTFTVLMNNVYNGNNPPNTTDYNVNISTISQNFNNGDKLRVKIEGRFSPSTVFSPNNSRDFLYFQYAEFRATTNYSADLLTNAPYFSGATFPTDQLTPQYITASSGLSSFMNQTPGYLFYPSQSLLNETTNGYGFNRPALPFNPQIGDYIRFEYDKNKQSKIYGITTLQDGRLVFQIYPSIPTGSQLNHFVITRMVNDGGSILSPSRKQSDGSFNSFIKPKYVSQTLTNNSPSIINTLEKDGLLTT